MTEATKRTPAPALLDGQGKGWTGQVSHFLGTITKDDTVTYDPPIRVLEITGDGNLVIVTQDDDETASASRATIAVKSGDRLTYWAIRQVRATSSTASVGNAWT